MAYGLTKSITLNGTSQYLSRADSTPLQLTGAQTHEAWFNFSSVPTSGDSFLIFSKYVAGSGTRAIALSYENSGGTKRFHARTSADGTNVQEGTLNYDLPTNTWIHLRFVYNTDGTITIYADGTSIGTIGGLTTSIRNTSASYQIGYNAGIASYIPAKVSLWRVWSGLHTTADQCTVYGTSTTDLKAEWSLDDVLTDGSGNGLTLTNNGSAVFSASLPSVCLPTLPTLDTLAATDITTTTATLNGEITDVGSGDAAARGFVYGTSSHADPGDTAPGSAGYDSYTTESGTFGAATFYDGVTGLTAITTYYVRAWAQNGDGYAYGDEVSFSTSATPPFRFTNLPGIVYDETDTYTIYAERLNDILERLEALEG